MDETRTLEDGQYCAMYMSNERCEARPQQRGISRSRGGGSSKPIVHVGEALVGRSPSLRPGDVRVLQGTAVHALLFAFGVVCDVCSSTS
eukprot:17845-Heterococcus_DN1.PRE.7